MRRPAGIVALTALAASLLAGCGGGADWSKKCTTGADGWIACAPGSRHQVEDVGGELLDGGKYQLSQDKGKVVVVNFWGSWCSPCRAEAADLEATYQATKDKGVAFVGVDSRDDRDAAKAFVRGRATYPNIYDFPGKVGVEFDVTQSSTPATLILDRQGRIAYALRKATTRTDLIPLVEKVAAEEGAS
jgi:thiol-disulfide isomerase/thioredoxin